ncbi:MAG TPA: sialidase family protein, partial [Steroidobacteraceae bacterium]|nr:sialidase family protein [Steroidobacteraceae bacterium]
MLFHRISSGILLALVIAASANAQRSVVFFKENNVSSHSEYDRPRPRLKLLKSFSLPQSVESHPSSASDFPYFNVTSFLLADEDEPSIAINPVDQNNIIMGCNDYRSDSSLWYFASTDGGVHWSGAPFRANWQLAGIATDPAVTFNSSGTALYSYGRIAAGIVFPPSYNLNDVVSFSSSDKGNSWSGPSRAVFDSSTPSSALKLADKYYIAVDGTPTSSFFNRSYLTWAEYQNNQSRIVITHSTDNGAHWSAPVAISPAAHFQCPIPATGPAGDVYVAYEDVAPSHLQIHVARSTDGGATFASDVIVASYRDLGRLYPNDSVYFHPVIKGHVRVNSFPSIAVDHSADHNGRIYLTYAANDANGRAHIYFSASDDNAGHWLVPRPVENDPNIHPTDKFFPWIAVDNSTGDVGIVCYDSRNDSLANELIDTYFLFSHNGGASFTPLRITPYSMDPHASSSRDTVGFGPGDSLEFIGDYLGLDVMKKHWYPSWTDTRVGYDQDIYVAIVRPYAPASPKGFQVVEDAATHLPDLSWSYDGLTTAGLPLGTFSFHLRRTDGLLDSILPPAARTFV